jgi:hypothetical protein
MTSEQKEEGKRFPRGKAQSVALARQRVNTNRPANIRSNGAATRVRHREFVADVAGVVAFGTQSYAVNPGVAATFPWLSTLADRYESYKFHKLHFIYETTKSASTDGSVQGLIDFDAADAAPTTKALFMGHANAVRAAVWQEFVFDARARDLHKFASERYVRSAAPAANLDIKTYDVGNFFIGVAGCADTSAIGELYVEYDVEFTTPQLNPAVAIAAAEPLTQFLVQYGVRAATDVLGSAPVSYGASYCTAATNTLTFTVAGDYLVEVSAAYGTSILGNSGGTATVSFSGTPQGNTQLGVITASVGQTLVFSSVSGSPTSGDKRNYLRISPQSQVPLEVRKVLTQCQLPRFSAPSHDGDRWTRIEEM